MKQITKAIVHQLLDKKLITKQDQELYLYGLNALILLLTNFFTALLLGHFTNHLIEVLVFFLFFIPLRSYAGGYHTKNKITCYFFSNFMILIIIHIPTIVSSKTAFSVISLLFFISIAIIILTAPIPNYNRIFDNIEQKVFMKRTRFILFIELLFIATSSILHLDYWTKLLMLAPITVSLLLIISIILKKIFKVAII
uniref:accessory gene regulator B family protein n=1 Tax=Agathobacter sp. TaxID=2021311 RepID=UPI004055DAB2